MPRQKISLRNGGKALADDLKLGELGEKSQVIELQVKDLGPQIGWRTVFLVEYVSSSPVPLVVLCNFCPFQAGPLLIHPVFYHFPKFWYGQDVVHSSLQKCVYAFVMLHFIKRELETLLQVLFPDDIIDWYLTFCLSVHRFSAGFMPLLNIFRKYVVQKL